MKMSAEQVKAHVRKLAGGNAAMAQMIVRQYFMERFLVRLSRSSYRDRFILKGGVLVSAMVGQKSRTTLDMDVTVRGFTLTVENAQKVVAEIALIKTDDGVRFHIDKTEPILNNADYGGVRVSLEAEMEQMRTPLKIDLSAGDAITPDAVVYPFKLIFGAGTIALKAYNLETILAEKLETILSRGVANTRMRDFYDVFILSVRRIDVALLSKAFQNTMSRRGSAVLLSRVGMVFEELQSDSEMRRLWIAYQRKFDYASGIKWPDAVEAASALFSKIEVLRGSAS